MSGLMAWRDTWAQYRDGIAAHQGWGLWMALSLMATALTAVTVALATRTLWGLLAYLLLAVRPAACLEQPGRTDG